MCNLKDGENCECGKKIGNTADRVEIVEKKVDSISDLIYNMKKSLDDLVSKHKKENEELFNNMKNKLKEKDEEILNQKNEIKRKEIEEDLAERKRLDLALNRAWEVGIAIFLLLLSFLAGKFL